MADTEELNNTKENQKEIDKKFFISKVEETFNNQGEYFFDEPEQDEDDLINKEPEEEPTFPSIMVSLAIIKDLIDVGDFTVIGIVVTTITSIIISIILFFWTFYKIKGGWWKKRILKKLWKRYVFSIIIEFIPWFKIIPTTTIFVLMAHYRNKKYVKLFNSALEDYKMYIENNNLKNNN